MPCPSCGTENPEEAIQCRKCGVILSHESADSHEVTIRRSTRDGLLIGRYRVQRELGRGGMGTVFLAEDVELDEIVAIKVLLSIIATDRRSIDGLRSEARIARSLGHPNIMRLHTFESSEECKFLVMEYINGPSLDDVLVKQGRLSPEVLFEIVVQACRGLSYAHSQRVIHRDIKPSNIMLAFPEDEPYNSKKPLTEQMNFTVKICDFGIAYQIKNSMSRMSKTETSGTLLYMSPEQLRGKGIDKRADIYSLGATIYELLSGSPPFTSGSIHFQILSENPAPIAGIPDRLNAVVLRCLAKDTGVRFASCEELSDALSDKEFKAVSLPGKPAEKEGGAPEPVTLRSRVEPEAKKRESKPTKTQAVPKARRKLKSSWLFACAFVLLIALTMGGYFLFRDPGRAERVEPLVPAAQSGIDEKTDVVKRVPIEEERRIKITRLLKRADEHFERQEYTTPAGRNAYDLYVEVLGLDPGNRQATEKIEEIRWIYVRWGDYAVSAGRYDKALRNYGKAKEVGLDEGQYEALVAKVEQAKRLAVEAEKQREEERLAAQRRKEEQPGTDIDEKAKDINDSDLIPQNRDLTADQKKTEVKRPEEALPGDIIAIETDEGPDWARISIIAAEGVGSYRSFELLGPDRVVLDFQDISLLVPAYPIELEGDLVKRIRFSVYDDKVRIVFDFIENLPIYTASEQGDRLVLVFGAGPPLSLSAPEKPDRSASPPGAVEMSDAGDLVSINYLILPDMARIIITTDSLIPYRTAQLSEDRIDLELPGARIDVRKEKPIHIADVKGPVAEIRPAFTNLVDGPGVRVSIILREPAKCWPSQQINRIFLDFPLHTSAPESRMEEAPVAVVTIQDGAGDAPQEAIRDRRGVGLWLSSGVESNKVK